MQEMLSVPQGRGLRVYVCLACLVCVGWRGRGRVCCEGSRVVCLRSPGEPESPLVLLHFPERIVFFLSEEERPAHRETGPKVGKLMTQQLKVQQTPGHRHKIYTYKEQKNLTNQRHEWALSVPPRWMSWSGRQRWAQQTSCCTGRQCRSYPASCIAQSLPGDQSGWSLTRRNKPLLKSRPHLLLLYSWHFCPLVDITKTTLNYKFEHLCDIS